MANCSLKVRDEEVKTKTHQQIVNRIDARYQTLDETTRDTVLRFSDLTYTLPSFAHSIGGIVNYIGTQDNNRNASTTVGNAQALENQNDNVAAPSAQITISDNDFDGLSTGNLNTKLNSFQIKSSSF